MLGLSWMPSSKRRSNLLFVIWHYCEWLSYSLLPFTEQVQWGRWSMHWCHWSTDAGSKSKGGEGSSRAWTGARHIYVPHPSMKRCRPMSLHPHGIAIHLHHSINKIKLMSLSCPNLESIGWRNLQESGWKFSITLHLLRSWSLWRLWAIVLWCEMGQLRDLLP